MSGWVGDHEALLWWLGSGSAAVFFLSLLAVPWLVVRIPPDYFVRERRPAARWVRLHPVLRSAWHLARNALGVVLVILGLALLVLPGQGILTILLGVMLLDFPRKYTLECWLVSRPTVFRTLNWLRRRAQVPPISRPRDPRA